MEFYIFLNATPISNAHKITHSLFQQLCIQSRGFAHLEKHQAMNIQPLLACLKIHKSMSMTENSEMPNYCKFFLCPFIHGHNFKNINYIKRV